MEVLVLNTNYKSVAIVDAFKELIWTDRYNAHGNFELYLSMDSSLLNHLRKDYYLWLKESEHCMIIEDLSIDSDAEDGNHLLVTGRSLESIIGYRIVWGQKILNGNLQNAIRTLIDESIVDPAIPDRKIVNFKFQESTDPRITGLTIDTQFTGDYLDVVVSKLCQENDIGYKVVLNDQNEFVFSLYAGLDRSYSQSVNPYVVFSPNFENIINSNYFTSKAGFKNVTLVAGEGEGASRKTVVVGSGSGLNRREIFTDARDISSDTENGTLSTSAYNALLTAKGTKTLVEHTEKTSFEGQVEATLLFKYGEDFFIGDIVQVANEYGHEGAAYIAEIVMSQNQEEISTYPTFQMIQE